MTQPKQLQQQAEELREQEHFFKALVKYQQAINGYLKQEKPESVAETYQGMAECYKHLFLQSKQKIYLRLGLACINTSLNLLKNSKSKWIANAYQIKAQLRHLMGNLKESIKDYQQAVKLYQRKDALKGRYLSHLGKVQYLAGDKETGLENLKGGLKTIRNHHHTFDDYTLDAWESGALLSLAKVLDQDRPKLAKQYLQQAKKIIDNNQKLIIRRKQWEALTEQINQAR